MKEMAVVSCYWCHTPNKIYIGHHFYHATAFYRCGKCNRPVSVHLKQYPLNKELTDIQIGVIK